MSRDDAEIVGDLAVVVYRTGRYEEGVELIRGTLDKGKPLAPNLNTLGNCLKDMGDAEGAVEAYRCALQIEPRYGGIHANLLHRLNGYFSSECRCLAAFEERIFFFQFHIVRQVSSGLAHHPYRGAFGLLYGTG